VETKVAVKIDTKLLLRLIRDQGTLEQVSAFLRARGLEHSGGNWNDMIENRLRTSLDAGKLTLDDFVGLLAEVEEHGRQHVFLYELGRGKSVDELFDESVLRKRLRQTPRFPELGQPSFIESPEQPTVVDVRYEMRGKTACLIIKLVEPRTQPYNRRETEARGRLTVTYDLRRYRAVNVVRIWETGFVDLRVFSHREAISYEGLAQALWGHVSPLVDAGTFRPVNLGSVRDAFWDKNRRKDMQKLFALRSSDHRNAAGNRLRAAATALDSTMFDDPDLVASMDRFHSEKSDAEVERATVSLLQEASNGILSRSVNLLLHGEPNEFTITGKVTRADYEFILDTLLKHNK
jgi:hypothetical protein